MLTQSKRSWFPAVKAVTLLNKCLLKNLTIITIGKGMASAHVPQCTTPNWTIHYDVKEVVFVHC